MDRSLPILFYDGGCNLCQTWVRFIHRYGPSVQLVSLHSETGRSLLAALGCRELPESIVLFDKDKFYYFSDAILQLSVHMRGTGKLLYALRILPRSFRDPVYRWIAKHRYRLFGSSRCCSVPGL